jgi:hypothetical protein
MLDEWDFLSRVANWVQKGGAAPTIRLRFGIRRGSASSLSGRPDSRQSKRLRPTLPTSSRLIPLFVCSDCSATTSGRRERIRASEAAGGHLQLVHPVAESLDLHWLELTTDPANVIQTYTALCVLGLLGDDYSRLDRTGLKRRERIRASEAAGGHLQLVHPVAESLDLHWLEHDFRTLGRASVYDRPCQRHPDLYRSLCARTARRRL